MLRAGLRCVNFLRRTGEKNDAETDPIPDEWNKPFWDACNERKLVVQNCTVCNLLQYLPAQACKNCGSSDALEWKEVAGRGHILDYYVIRDSRIQRRQADQPFNFAVVTLDEDPGLNFLSNLPGTPVGEVSVGAAVPENPLDAILTHPAPPVQTAQSLATPCYGPLRQTAASYATHSWNRFRQTKALFGLGDFLEQAHQLTRYDRSLTRLLPCPVVKPSFHAFSLSSNAINNNARLWDQAGCGSLSWAWAFSPMMKQLQLSEKAKQQRPG